MTEAVKVMVRCRPMSIKQKQRGCKSVVFIDQKTNQVSVTRQNAKQPPKSFSYDCVFGVDSLQSVVYEQTAFSLVDNVLQGYNGTIFAYGQTGCGKTHTMMGSTQTQQSKGIIPRTFHQIITLTNSQKDKKHLVQCSFIQIYNEQIHDLLGKDIKARMQLKQSPDKGVFVKDLTMNIVKTEKQMQKFMQLGFKNRAVRQTAMNKQSSRSHSLFTIHIESQQTDQISGDQKFKVGKLNLVDLAGSERQSKTNATGDGMKQAAKINLSLSALGNVISSLVDGKTHHIPYRDSKLTRLLQDSLGGNTKTIMIAAVSPADYNFDQTLSTLRYASRAKFIQNKPIVNEDPKDTLLKQYAQQIKKLKLMLQGKAPMDSSALHLSNQGGNPQIIYKQVIVNADGSKTIQQNSQNNNNISNDLQNQLKSKQDQLKSQQQQKRFLKEQMQKLQNIISRQDTQVDKKEIQKMNKLKQKLQKQKKKQQDYKNEKKRRQQQLLNLQTNYKSLNEQVEVMRNKFLKIKAKYIQNAGQLRDIQSEHQGQKEQLLDTIRFQQSQVNKYSGIIKMLLTNDQIEQIVQQSSFNDETREWNIVPFYYRQKSVNFPKLGANHTKQLIQNQKQKKQIVFKDSQYRDNGYSNSSFDNSRQFSFNNNKKDENGYNNNNFNCTTKRQDSHSEYNNNADSVSPSIGSNAISKSKESFRISEVVKGARQTKNSQNNRQKDKSQYSGNLRTEHHYSNNNDARYERNSSSHNHLTSLNNIQLPQQATGVKVPKNPQLTPLKGESKLDEKNLHYLNNNNNNESANSIGSMNKVKLNPIQRNNGNSRRDISNYI